MPSVFAFYYEMAGDLKPDNLKQQVKRPGIVTVLIVVVLITTSINSIRLFKTVSLWEFISSLPRISPLYLALTGLFWTLVGLLLLWGLWTGRAWVPKATRIVTLAYATYYWLDRTLVARNAGEQSNWPFAAGMTIFLLAFIFFVLAHRYTRTYFGEVHEEQSKN